MRNPGSRAMKAARAGRVPLTPSVSWTAATAAPVRFTSSRSAIMSMSLPTTPMSTSPTSVSRMSLASMASNRSYRSATSPNGSPLASPLLFRRNLASMSETASEVDPLGSSPPKELQPSLPPSPMPVIGAAPVQDVLSRTATLLADDIGGSADWYNRVLDAERDLQSVRRRRLAVIGDPLAAPQDVVSVFLQDPLSDSENMRRAVLDRYFGTSTSTLKIEYSEKVSRTEGHMTCAAGWLQASKCDVWEVDASAPKEEILSTLLASDALCIVLDPIRLADAPVIQQILPVALPKGKIQFVVNGPLPPHVSETSLRDTLHKQIKEVVSPGLHGPPAYDVDFVRAETALGALEALSKALAGTAPKGSAFEKFQHDFLASNMSTMAGDLVSIIPADAQIVTAANTAHLALAYVEGVITADRKVLAKTRNVVDLLKRETTDGAGKARRLSLVARGIAGGVVEGSVDQSLDSSARDIRHLFKSRFSWLSLVARLKVDDVGAELGAYISRSWARDMESQLMFEAGELSQLQTALGSRADNTARTLSIRPSKSTETGHPFTSPVLMNHLKSLALSIPPVTPTTLLPPVTTRRQQLLTTAVPRLQVSAQRALLSTYALAFLGVSGSWCLCVPPLSMLSTYTSVGLGALSVVASLALGQTLWAKAQKRWWKDWDRVTAMLKDDLADNYDKVVDTLILARPRVASDGLTELVKKRENRLDDMEKHVRILHAKVEQTGDLQSPAQEQERPQV